jgi:hypothetical protein
MAVNKMNVADSFILATCTILLVLMSLVTRKVFKIVGFGDKRLMLMLIFLDLSLVGMCTIEF